MWNNFLKPKSECLRFASVLRYNLRPSTPWRCTGLLLLQSKQPLPICWEVGGESIQKNIQRNEERGKKKIQPLSNRIDFAMGCERSQSFRGNPGTCFQKSLVQEFDTELFFWVGPSSLVLPNLSSWTHLTAHSCAIFLTAGLLDVKLCSSAGSSWSRTNRSSLQARELIAGHQRVT